MALCRRSDVGKPKAVVAADFINRRVAGCNVTAYLLHCFHYFCRVSYHHYILSKVLKISVPPIQWNPEVRVFWANLFHFLKI